MKPTELLSAEHRVIEQALDCLEAISRRCEADGTLDAAGAKTVLEFIREFADTRHHMKEETHLFPYMEERGYPRNGGPVGVMLMEHQQGRTHVQAMAAVLEGAASGDSEDCGVFQQHANSFVALLRQHIEKEDHCLFPMADQAMDPAGQSKLERLFQVVDHEELGEELRGRHLINVDGLADRLGLRSGRGREFAGKVGQALAAEGEKA